MSSIYVCACGLFLLSCEPIQALIFEPFFLSFFFFEFKFACLRAGFFLMNLSWVNLRRSS